VIDVELKGLVAALGREQKETIWILREKWAEVDRALAELARESAETERRLSRQESMAGIHFGRLVEAIVEPSCLKLFQARGLPLTQSMRRLKGRVEGTELEIDILLTNSIQAVAVAVKSAFRVSDVKEFLEDLKLFRKVFPNFAKHTLYGAVAALEYMEECERFAARKGLFVLKSASGLMEIANPLNFRAKKL
jgi:hypothetical protein